MQYRKKREDPTGQRALRTVALPVADHQVSVFDRFAGEGGGFAGEKTHALIFVPFTTGVVTQNSAIAFQWGDSIEQGIGFLIDFLVGQSNSSQLNGLGNNISDGSFSG